MPQLDRLRTGRAALIGRATRTTLVTLATMAGTLTTLPASALETLDEIVGCVNGNVPQRTFSQMVGISAFDRIGVERRLIARMWGQRTEDNYVNTMVRVDRPDDLQGARYLVRGQEGEDEMHMFLPALNASRQIRGEAGQSKLWGTDFSYQDILQIFGSFAEGKMTRHEDANLMGRTVYEVSVKPSPSTNSAYETIQTSVDQRTCLTLQVRFYESGERLRKTLTMNPEVISREDGRFVGHEYTMSDLRDKTRTTVYLGDVIYDEEPPEGVFSPRGYRYVN